MARTKMTSRKSQQRVNPFSRRIRIEMTDTPMTINTSATTSQVLQHPVSIGIIVEHVRHGVYMYNKHQLFEYDSLDDYEVLQLFAYVVGAVNDHQTDNDAYDQHYGVLDEYYISLYQNLHNHMYSIFLMCDPSKQPHAIKFIPNRQGTALNYVAYPLVRIQGRIPNQYDIFTAWLRAHCTFFNPKDFYETLQDLQDVDLNAEGEFLFCLEIVDSNSQEMYKRAEALMISLIRHRIPIEIRTRIWYALMLSSEQFANV